jgi:hypothetical protein
MGGAVDDLTPLIDQRIEKALAEREKRQREFWRRIWRAVVAIARAIESEYRVKP